MNRKSRIFSIRRISLYLLILLIAGGIFGFHIIREKTVWTTDEPISLSLANQSENNGWVNLNKPGWVEKSDWLGFFVTDHPFDYRQVWINQTNDTHPILFYTVLHTMYSLFPYSENPDLALFPNLVYYLVAAWAVFDLVRRITQRNDVALAASACQLFNPVILYTMQLARMYCLAQMILTLFADVCVRILQKEESHRIQNVILLGLLTSLGALTHYYCYLFILLMCLLCLIYLSSHGRKKYLWYYAGSVAAGFLCSLLIFPGVRDHFYSSAHVKIAVSNMEGGIAFKLGRIADFWKGNPFGSLFLLILAVLFSVLLVLAIKKDKSYLKEPNQEILFGLTACSAAYFILIASSATFIEHRYIAPIDSILIVCVMSGACMILQPYRISVKKTAAVALCICIISCLPTLHGISSVPYAKSGIRYSLANPDATCIVITRHKVYGYWVNNLLFELKNYQRTYLAETDSVPSANDQTESIGAGSVVYIYNDISQQDALEWLQKWTSVSMLEPLSSVETANFTIYLAH